MVDKNGKRSRKTLMLFDKLEKGDTINVYNSASRATLKAEVLSDGILKRININRHPRRIDSEF
jgi:hypothetical protein